MYFHVFLLSGLYRCRLGDVVEVAGFHNGTPKLNFICRRKLILTVNIDKNTERDLQIVVEKGSQLLNKAKAELVDFTSYADVSNQPGCYVIFWEIKGEAEDKVLEACCREMDAAFVDHGYVVSEHHHLGDVLLLLYLLFCQFTLIPCSNHILHVSPLFSCGLFLFRVDSKK